jgi:cystathionine beta-lyase/cystathionine gamma-synthase
MDLHLETLSVHAGREDFRTLGVHAPPIDLSSTYPIHDLMGATASLDAFVNGEQMPHEPIYSRLYNPTVARFEQALASLEAAEAGVAFASGMAAMTAVLMAVRSRGTHLVAVRPIYGSNDHLLSCGMLGFETTWTTPDEIHEAIRPDTALVIIETPANPTLALVDIEWVVAQAGDVPVLVDSTFATPVLQRPLDWGATFVLHSATKFLGGHGDVLAGVVATSEAWAKSLRQVRIMTGAVLHPLAAFLLHRGLATLPLRVEKSQSNALVLVDKLANHLQIMQVFHPSLSACDPLGLVGRQMSGSGSIIAFEMAGGYAAAAALLAHLKLITPAVSLGSTDTIIQHPAGLTHRVVSEEGKKQGHISDGLLRISVGLEHPDDLWHDLEQAFDAVAEILCDNEVQER